MPEDKGNDRPSYGYTTEGGERVSALRDMFNGGGPGRSGPTFQGGGIISSIGNAMGGPSMFGGGDGGGNRGAQIGRMAGGMMFGPLGMIGGGILGNLLGGGMNRGLAQGVSPVPAQAPRPAGSPAMVALAPAGSMRPPMRKTTPGNVPLSAQPGFFAPPQPNIPLSAQPGFFAPPQAMPSAVDSFIAQYGGYTPPPLPGAVPMSIGVTMPGTDPMSSPMVGYMPRTPMPMDPMIDPRNMVSLPIDRMTGRPMAMTPPRVQ